MTDELDLDAYYARIGWTGERAARPTDTLLAQLLDHHMRSIPFENLDVLLGRPPRLDLASLQAKLVAGHRGGYCFEHTTLMAAVLERLGFAIARHSARVTMRTPRSEAPRTHMFLTVELPAATVVVDPGFGGQASRLPVPLGGRAGDYTFHRDGDLHVLRFHSDELWVSTLERDHPIDFELANYYTARHPSSPFTQRLMMSVWTRDERVGVMNRDVTIHRGADVVSKRRIADRDELRALVADWIGRDIPEIARIAIPTEPEWSA